MIYQKTVASKHKFDADGSDGLLRLESTVLYTLMKLKKTIIICRAGKFDGTNSIEGLDTF